MFSHTLSAAQTCNVDSAPNIIADSHPLVTQRQKLFMAHFPLVNYDEVWCGSLSGRFFDPVTPSFYYSGRLVGAVL